MRDNAVPLVGSPYLIDPGCLERAQPTSQKCSQLEHKPELRASILANLGYRLSRLGWLEEAATIYAEYVKIPPSDNDAKFFLARPYSSMT